MNSPTASAPPAERFEPRSETDTRLSGYWLVLVRLLCLALCVLSVGFYVAGVLSYIANDYTFCAGPAAAGVLPPLPMLAHALLNVIGLAFPRGGVSCDVLGAALLAAGPSRSVTRVRLRQARCGK